MPALLHPFLLLLLACIFARGADRPNVLFIVADDLRPELGCYGVAGIQTPHLDALAARGTVFTRAYCQQAVCSPSRSSLMTGRRPDSTRVFDLVTHFRKALPEVVTLPQHFIAHGWHAQAVGKIYHPGYDDAPSWSAPGWMSKMPQYRDAATVADLALRVGEAKAAGKPATGPKGPRGPSFEAEDCEDNQLADGDAADRAITLLGEFKAKEQPFFLALGFLEPHLPFVAPKKYFDLYDAEKIPPATNTAMPKGAPKFAGNGGGDLRTYFDIPKGSAPVTPAQARELKRAYWAATSYMDAQLGRVLAELDRLGLREKTIVVVWGDHGWKLGEHGLWAKHCNWEDDCRAPLIVSVPGQKNAGAKCDALVEFVDVYPTLCEAAGLPLPAKLEGLSFLPLLADPQRTWKSAVFSQYPRAKVKAMGRSMRTDRYRYIEWQRAGSEKIVARELYDHATDPQENTSLAAVPEHAALIGQLSAQLRAGWRAALPAGK